MQDDALCPKRHGDCSLASSCVYLGKRNHIQECSFAFFFLDTYEMRQHSADHSRR